MKRVRVVHSTGCTAAKVTFTQKEACIVKARITAPESLCVDCLRAIAKAFQKTARQLESAKGVIK